MEKAQAWLQENFGILLGVCAGVAVIEVCPSPCAAFPWALSRMSLPSCPYIAAFL